MMNQLQARLREHRLLALEFRAQEEALFNNSELGMRSKRRESGVMADLRAKADELLGPIATLGIAVLG